MIPRTRARYVRAPRVDLTLNIGRDRAEALRHVLLEVGQPIMLKLPRQSIVEVPREAALADPRLGLGYPGFVQIFVALMAVILLWVG